MKMYEILELANIYNSIKDNKMPLKTVYKFTCLMRQVEKETAFYQSEFTKILETYGLKDETGNYVLTEDNMSVRIIEGKEVECQEAIINLRNLEVEELNVKFDLSELEDLNFTIAEMNYLMPLIND